MAAPSYAEGRRRAIGDIFEGYKIDFLHELGRGGFGMVYEGWDTNNRAVAVKKITRNAGPRAHREALSLQKLKEDVSRHPNIISIHCVQYWSGAIWIVIELCHGGDVEQCFKNRFEEATNTSTKLNIIVGVTNGLEYLHSQQIVHRDIKPANILISQIPVTKNAIKIADFGLCKILNPDESTMSSNVGTVLFKAPEFFDPKSDERIRYNRSVDIYATGLSFAAILQAKKGRSLLPKVCLHFCALVRKVLNNVHYPF